MVPGIVNITVEFVQRGDCNRKLQFINVHVKILKLTTFKDIYLTYKTNMLGVVD